MGDQSGTPPSDKPRILDYADPAVPRRRRPSKYLGVTIALAIGLHLAMGIAGVASDRIRIALAKKIALTLASAVIMTLMIRATHGRRFGFAVMAILFALYTCMAVAVMWFWN